MNQGWRVSQSYHYVHKSWEWGKAFRWVHHNANRCWNFFQYLVEGAWTIGWIASEVSPQNSAKTSVLQDFLKFVDINNQPNGQLADSTGPTHYLLPKFTTIQMPKNDVSNYEERLQRSVVGKFNRAQRERSRGECSNSSSHNWLKRPKVAICPRQTIVTRARKEMWKSMVHRRQSIAYSSSVMQIQRRSRKGWDFCPPVISRESPTGSTESSLLLRRSN